MASRHRKTVQKRTECLLVIFMTAFLLVGGRLTQIQVFANQRYQQLAEKLRLRQVQIPAQRGIIRDRLGRELAINLTTASIYVQPSKVKSLRQTAQVLSEITGQPVGEILEKIDSQKKFVWVARGVDARVGAKVKKLDLAGVGTLNEPRRVYPSGELASHILGFTDTEGNGLEGVEKSLDKYLNGTNGFIVAEVDPRGRFIPETRQGMIKPVDGNDVALTIDSNIQHITEEALAKICKAYKPVGASAVVMNPKTGEILALANAPTFNPNNRKGITPGVWRNRAVTDLYEPGSTLKAMTAAAGLEEGIAPGACLSQCTGRMPIGGRAVRCVLHAPYHNGHGSVDMHKMIAFSCNAGAASLGIRIGSDGLYKYEQAFGLLDKPGSGLGGEAVGWLDDPSKWGTMRTANIGFGQGIVVTPLQMAAAYAAVANGGVLMRPQIIREIRGKDGKLIKQFKPEQIRRVMSEENARTLAGLLEGCVDEGTGKPATVDNYSIAGKTGSAQKASANGRGYAGGKFIASFMGFAPAKNARLVIAVVVDEPQGSHWGATVAAPVFQEIAAKAMWYLKVPPDHPSADAVGAHKKC